MSASEPIAEGDTSAPTYLEEHQPAWVADLLDLAEQVGHQPTNEPEPTAPQSDDCKE